MSQLFLTFGAFVHAEPVNIGSSTARKCRIAVRDCPGVAFFGSKDGILAVNQKPNLARSVEDCYKYHR